MKEHIEIIFENSDFLVINKPSGLVVNRSKTTKELTLQDYLEEKVIDESGMEQEVVEDITEDESDFKSRNGIVHRLDKDTSGVILVAKNEEYFLYLQSLFKERKIKKEYETVVLGKVVEERFEIDAPIGRDPKSRFRFAIVRGEKEAQTYIEKIKEIDLDGQIVTSLKCFPRTGRTHQIRVHLAAYGFPILGDNTYSSYRDSQTYETLGINRLMLHSKSVTFNGMNGEEFYFECETPEQFSKFM